MRCQNIERLGDYLIIDYYIEKLTLYILLYIYMSSIRSGSVFRFGAEHRRAVSSSVKVVDLKKTILLIWSVTHSIQSRWSQGLPVYIEFH